MKNRSKSGKTSRQKASKTEDSDSNQELDDIFTDEIQDFTNERNNVERDIIDKPSDSEDEEELFGMAEDDEESDEEIGEWSKRLKQLKFQARLDKNKPTADAPDKSWGTKRSDFYGSGVRRKPKAGESDEEDEWEMEEKEIEKLQKKLDEDLDEDDFLIPTLKKKKIDEIERPDITVQRNLSSKEKEELRKKLHPEAGPLREELNKCLEELEELKSISGWKAQSRDTCFRMLAANVAFYLHLIDNDEDCRGHPVLKRIVQWKKLSKMYKAMPMELMEVSDEESSEKELNDKEEPQTYHPPKKSRLALEDSEDELASADEEENVEAGDMGEFENRPITYEIEKNKKPKKSAPNNPRVKHREKFRKAKIRRRGQIREAKTEVHKYQGEASGIRAGIVKSVKFK